LTLDDLLETYDWDDLKRGLSFVRLTGGTNMMDIHGCQRIAGMSGDQHVALYDLIDDLPKYSTERAEIWMELLMRWSKEDATST
jgi:hypothetical protein